MKTLKHILLTIIHVLLLLTGITLSTISARADYWLTNQPASTWGTWDGWGCSLAWWANAFGTNDLMANLIFSTNYTSYQGVLVCRGLVTILFVTMPVVKAGTTSGPAK